MKKILCVATTLALLSSPLDANDEVNLEKYYVAGNIFVFEDLKNVGWLLGEIVLDDYFNLREIIRKYEIDTLILDSPGGDLYEGLYMAAVLHDRGINTYIPTEAYCESSCANVFFAGHSRVASGHLGVHQFSSERTLEEQELTQVTVADIISFLNEFATPPIVYEKIFLSDDIYYFSKDEINRINRRQEFFTVTELDIYDRLFVEIMDMLYVGEQSLANDSELAEAEVSEEEKTQIINLEILAVMSALTEGVVDIEIFCSDPNAFPHTDLFFYGNAYWNMQGQFQDVNGFVFNGRNKVRDSEAVYFINGIVEKSERWEAQPYKVSFTITEQSSGAAESGKYDFEWRGKLEQDSADASALSFMPTQELQASCSVQFFLGGL